ncbi:glutathione synthase [Fluoribacter dumoffii]|uniref:Glutathione synthetase n=1 Tax=Fluoribacter dumoffii TaxID=463 RepID=A0A377G9G5_9GAMM|nr:glutathione synthase [Fluoribacter dumoffii]KTC89910.1 glutathione synthetase [Fluoribacter dumoffii NY 23]MCW8385208.1 glutathione synthase [Fluoribacter dumoffii]MCW8418262.1 glutathione synthase [Fluoribacter dumoffii]MCW8453896.1 glutathione synthase [Fluoribacter dumoffii]MCW8462033.1 glutathione synthase [Fluoribacter dumoffii]
MKLGVLLDPLSQLIPYKDTSLALIKRAQEMGWSCFVFTQDDLFCKEGRAFAQVYDLRIGDLHSKDWATIKMLEEQPLSELDIILMRKDPPFNIEYIYTTYILELAEREGVLVANKPQSLRDANEKFFTLNFPQCCPTTLVSRNMKRLKSFWMEHQQVIFKPLEGMGGNSVFHVEEHGENLAVILEVLTKNQTQTIIAQRYIPEIKKTGDKRIILINGEPVPYALARIPAEGDLRGNLAAGARGEVVPITERDRWICQQIKPTLIAKGLYFVGIDVIGDYLTEINVTSPTCLREIEAATKLDIAGDYLRCLEKICRA